MPRGMWGPYRMGVNGAYNIVEGNVGAYNTVRVRVVAEYCTGYGPWYRGLTPCALACFFRSSPGSFRAGVPGRIASVGPGRAS